MNEHTHNFAVYGCWCGARRPDQAHAEPWYPVSLRPSSFVQLDGSTIMAWACACDGEELRCPVDVHRIAFLQRTADWSGYEVQLDRSRQRADGDRVSQRRPPRSVPVLPRAGDQALRRKAAAA